MRLPPQTSGVKVPESPQDIWELESQRSLL